MSALPAISALEYQVSHFQRYDTATHQYVDDPSVPQAESFLYTVEGVTEVVNGVTQNRRLSMAELVMIICLARAADKEARVIELMRELSDKTAMLEYLTEIEQNIVNDFSTNDHTAGVSNPYDLRYHFVEIGGYSKSYKDYLYYNAEVTDYSTCWVYSGTSLPTPGQDITYDDLVAKIEAKMDSLNSFSQKTMIELQSETNKRDQSYDMITNILKSLNTVQVGIVNNI